ncbi:hypothetical protein JXB11_02270 [Candidatus Woesearchaeota archaeon]|nr:hypothetical protein [Candidatus Woesearchaeota archaeon]
MKRSFKLILGILILAFILLAVFSTPEKEEATFDFPIETEEEALAYARQNPEVQGFIKGWSDEQFYEQSRATWDEASEVWEVVINPIGEAHFDYLFLIVFYADGKVTHSGVVETA